MWRDRRVWWLLIGLGSLALGAATAAQVTREEFEALSGRVKTLEAHVTMLRKQVKKLMDAPEQPGVASSKRGQPDAILEEPKANQESEGIVTLESLEKIDASGRPALRVNATTATALVGRHVTGTVRFHNHRPSPTNPEMLIVRMGTLGAGVYWGNVFCEFELPFGKAARLDGSYEIRGKVTEATFIPGRLIKKAQVIPGATYSMGGRQWQDPPVHQEAEIKYSSLLLKLADGEIAPTQ